MFLFLRVFIGVLFLVSGVEKAFHPYQNFLYALQAYQVLPGWAEIAVAHTLPWVEVIVGVFLVLGLWTQVALKTALGMFAVFIVVVGQALLRGLPIDQCGCFGAMLHLHPRTMIVFDSFMLLATFMLLRNGAKTQQWSLDRRFRR